MRTATKGVLCEKVCAEANPNPRRNHHEGVRPSYAKKKYAKSHEQLIQIVQEGIQARATGNSNVHQHSSRSHAILELEITTQHILDLQEQLETLGAEATRIGHERDILEMDIFRRQRVKVEGKACGS